MKYFLLILVITVGVSFHFYLDKEPVVEIAGSLSVAKSKNTKASSEEIREKQGITHPKVKSLSSSPPNPEKVDDSYFSVKKDCYTDYARKIYEDMLYEHETRNWLSKRKYDLYYQNSHLKNYQSFNERSLKSMANNGDTRAMMRLGFNSVMSKNDSAGMKWYQNMIIEGDFSAIDQFIILYTFNITEANNEPEKSEAKERLLNWVAFKRVVNGLELFSLTAEYDKFLSKENFVWAQNKLDEINKIRINKGLQVIETQPLPKAVNSTLENLKKFYIEQKSIPNSPCNYHM